MIKYSVIIAVYNEEKVVADCLASLAQQTVAKDMEIIVIDDGSTDNTLNKIQDTRYKIQTLKQNHKGPGAARNLGASQAKGDILVFVDADMEFEKDFIEKLIAPIVSGKAIGTFSREEYLLNKENAWARCWNLSLGRETERMIGGEQYKEESPVYRAILKSKFDEAGGFDTIVGYTDDWSISKKLGIKSQAAQGAKFYHRNPDTLKEIWIQARWFGKNEFLTKNLVRKLYNLFRYCPVWAVFKIYNPHLFIFKVVYNTAVFTSVILSFTGESKSK